LFGSLEERKMRDFGGQKYTEKLRNLSHFLKGVFFLESDKLMFMINIFLVKLHFWSLKYLGSIALIP